jgi:hypothetical protein
MKKNFAFLFLSLFFLLLVNRVNAADYHWVGGSGSWSQLSHWASSAGGAGSVYTVVPRSVDNVFFDAGSFSGPNQTVTIDTTLVSCNNMDWTGVTFNPTLTSSSASNVLSISGSLIFVSGMTLTFNGPINFAATTTGKTITTAGKIIPGVLNFNGVGGGWTLQDALTNSGAHPSLNLYYGSLNTNGQTVTTSSFYSYCCGTGGTRSLTMGASVFNTNVGWYVTTADMTLNSGSSVINISSNNPNFRGGGFTYNTLNFNGTNGPIQDGGNTFNGNVTFSGTGSISSNNTFNANVSFLGTGNSSIDNNNTFNGNTLFSGTGAITGNNSFNNLNFTPGYTYTLTAGKTQTLTGTLTANGTCGAFITLKSSTAAPTIISDAAGTVSANYVYLNSITATGGANFTATNAIDQGNNAGWTINALSGSNLYWIGNAGNWSDGNHWSLTSGGIPSGCAPTSLDNVFFDANSFSAGNQNVTIDVITASCNTMNWTGVSYTPTFAGAASNSLNIYGSLTFVSGMSMTFNGLISFLADTLGKTITTGGQVIPGVLNFSGIGGGWTLLDALTNSGAHPSLNLFYGSLNTNGQTVTTASVYSYCCGNGGTRSLTMGASVFNTVVGWYVTTADMTLNSGSSVINISSNNPNFQGGGFTYNILNFTGANGPFQDNGNTFNGNVTFSGTGSISNNNTFNANVYFLGTGNSRIDNNNTFNGNTLFSGTGTITGNNSFNNLNFTAGYTYTLTAGKTQTITGTLTANGTCGAFITIKSSAVAPTIISHPAGTVSTNYIYLNYITATGGANFTATNAVDQGNNTGWTINALSGNDLYWIGNAGNWSDGNHWSLTSGGIPSGCAPTSLDNVFFDANSFSAGNQNVTIDVITASCNTMNWTGASYTPTFAGSASNSLNIYGSLTFVSGMSITYNGPVSFLADTLGKTITTGGKVIPGVLNFSGIGGGWALQDALTNSGAHPSLNLFYGSLNTNDQTVTTASVYSYCCGTGGTRSLTMGASVFNTVVGWYVTTADMTLNSGSSVINISSNNPNFQGGGFTYNMLNFTGANGPIQDNGNTFNGNVTFSGTGSISSNNTFNANVSFLGTGNSRIDNNNTFNGNTLFSGTGAITGNNSFNNLNFTPGYTYTLTAGKTQTITGTLTISGTGSLPVRIQSSSPGNQSTFSKTSGTVCADYIRISDNNATGGATFAAGTNSQDLGGNTGWNFNGGGLATVTISSSQTGSICSGTPVTFTASAVNADNPVFDWRINGISVQSGVSDTFTTSALNNNDTIYCVMTSVSNCFSSGTSLSDTLIIDNAGSTAGIVSAAKDSICAGGTANLLVTGSSGNIQWQSSTSDGNYENIENATEFSYNGIINQTTYYRIYSTNGSCTDTSNSVQVFVAVPAIASFTYAQGNEYQVSFSNGSSNAGSFFWDFGNNSTSTAENPEFSFPFEGTYPVSLIASNGCNQDTFTLDVIVLKNVGIDHLSDNRLILSPNPFQENLNITYNLNAPESLSITIYNSIGQQVYTQQLAAFQDGSFQVNTSGLSDGIYYLKITALHVNFFQPIVKIANRDN